MGLFELFKRKSAVDLEITNLEELLMNAATDPSYRVEFYKQLLRSDLIVLTQDSEIGEGVQTLQEDTSLKILSLPDGRIPVFTSTDRVFDKKVIEEQVQYVAMKGADLLAVVKGATLLLNPYSDYGKELLPDEIDGLLDGTIFSSGGQTIVTSKPTEVLLGQPAKVPHEMLNSLQSVLTRRPEVSVGYLGWIDMPGDNNVPPHYIVGIEAGEYTRELVEEVGSTANQFLGPNEFIDIIELKENDGVSDYLRGTEPFYRR